jgi:hypothetical protein
MTAFCQDCSDAPPEAASQVEAWLDSTTPAWLSTELLASSEAEDLRPRLASLRAALDT